MAKHESSVNYQNLIRDLADMYAADVAEVVVIELIANSLDAGASRITVDYDPSAGILTVTDNGTGMNASQFDEYHNFAAGLKTRGAGIGFAGVGAKISFNVADRVITQTRSQSFAGGSDWYLHPNGKLLWDDLQPSKIEGNGTTVEVYFRHDSLPPFASTQDLIRLLRQNYLPLFDAAFLDLYQRIGCYATDLRFAVNGQTIEPTSIVDDFELEKVKKFSPKRAGKMAGYGIFGLSVSEYPLGPNICGTLLCTRGKVIKAELFNQFPGNLGPRLLGVVEVPQLIDFLTTNKTDFTRPRGKYQEFESLYGPVREEFKNWLAEIGVQSVEASHTDQASKLERELRKLVSDVPELGEFFGGSWGRKTVLRQDNNGDVSAVDHLGVDFTFPSGEGSRHGHPGLLDAGEKTGSVLVEDQERGTAKATPISRKGRTGPKVSFASAPDRVELAWVEGNNIVINNGHPSYKRADSQNISRTIHCLFAVGCAIQRFLATQDSPPDLILTDRLMAAWGNR